MARDELDGQERKPKSRNRKPKRAWPLQKEEEGPGGAEERDNASGTNNSNPRAKVNGVKQFGSRFLISDDEAWEKITPTGSALWCMKHTKGMVLPSKGVMLRSRPLPCKTRACRRCSEFKVTNLLAGLYRRIKDEGCFYVTLPTDQFRSDRLSSRLNRKRTEPADFYFWAESGDTVAILSSVNLAGRLPPTEMTFHDLFTAMKDAAEALRLPDLGNFRSSQTDEVEGEEDEGGEWGEGDGEEEEWRLLGFATDPGWELIIEEAREICQKRYGEAPEHVNGTLVHSDKVSGPKWAACLEEASLWNVIRLRGSIHDKVDGASQAEILEALRALAEQLKRRGG